MYMRCLIFILTQYHIKGFASQSICKHSTKLFTSRIAKTLKYHRQVFNGNFLMFLECRFLLKSIIFMHRRFLILIVIQKRIKDFMTVYIQTLYSFRYGSHCKNIKCHRPIYNRKNTMLFKHRIFNKIYYFHGFFSQ